MPWAVKGLLKLVKPFARTINDCGEYMSEALFNPAYKTGLHLLGTLSRLPCTLCWCSQHLVYHLNIYLILSPLSTSHRPVRCGDCPTHASTQCSQCRSVGVHQEGVGGNICPQHSQVRLHIAAWLVNSAIVKSINDLCNLQLKSKAALFV